jgi:glycosyltransferase involved in cell wall biosynthesis
MVAEFVRRGHDVTVLTGVPNYPGGEVFADFDRDASRFMSFGGARICRVPILVRGQSYKRLALNYVTYALSAAVVGSWKLRGCKFDAIFVYEPSPVTVGIPAVVLRWLKGAPVVFWVLDLWPETLQAIGVVRSRAVLRAVGALVSFIYKRCDLILAQSKSFMPQIAKYCRADRRIAYFPSWSEPLRQGLDDEMAPEVPILPNSFNVMFAGNIGEAQDFPAVLAAAELLKDDRRIRWLLVGDGRRAQWVREEIRRRGLEERVLMLGAYPAERMPSFYRHADALLASLKDEPIFAMTIPGKIQSYLATGVPIVAMLNGEGAELVRRTGAGISCSAGDSRGLAAAVKSLASMPKYQRDEMGKNAVRVSSDEFSRDKLIARLEGWLEGMQQERVTTSVMSS